MIGRRGRFLSVLLLILVAAACSPAPPQGVVLNRGNGSEPKSLDPDYIDSSAEGNIEGDLFAGLTTEDAAGRPIPGAAADWTVSPDGLTWTFRLRRETWSDGVEVTAGDFVFAWRRLLDPATASPYAYMLWVVKNAKAVSAGKLPPSALGVRAVDGATLEVTLSHPAPYLPALLDHHTAYPLPQHTIAKYGSAWARPEHFTGNGAYVVKEWVPDDHITLVKNRRFYDAKHVRIDVVNYYPTVNSSAALNRIRAGELDTQSPLPAQEIGWLRAHMPKALQIAPYLGIAYVSINVKKEPFDDRHVREALSLAYDREALAGKILKLGERPAYSIVPPGIADYPDGAKLSFEALPHAARVAKARALMREAGYGPAHPLKASYATTTDPDNLRIAAAVQAMMRAIDVEITIAASDLPAHLQKMRSHDFELAGSSWIADYEDATNFLELLRSDSGKNYGSYANPRYDALLSEAEGEPDATRRGALLVRAEQVALDDYAWIPVRYMVTRDLVQPYVKGWIPNRLDVNRTRWLSIDREK
jgi:oligopeptide transport system substrate-binding protein